MNPPDGDDEGPAVARTIIPSSAAVSERMSRHPRRDTAPELQLRRLLHASGLRYRVQRPVPGMPRRTIDIAFTRQKVAVFVDGCFWHGCADHRTVPASNGTWWRAKLDRNRLRDAETSSHLEGLGWVVIRVWEHDDPLEAATDIRARLLQIAQQNHNATSC